MPKVATCLLMRDGKLLILKRSKNVRTYKGLWGGVAGYVEEHENPYETALKEIHEEVGLEPRAVELKKQGEPVSFVDVYEGKTYEWIIYPFVFRVNKRGKIKIDWEHTEYRWILITDIAKYTMVPHLKEMIIDLLG